MGQEEETRREGNASIGVGGEQSLFVEHIHPFSSLPDFAHGNPRNAFG
jgi:hypothetical protein